MFSYVFSFTFNDFCMFAFFVYSVFLMFSMECFCQFAFFNCLFFTFYLFFYVFLKSFARTKQVTALALGIFFVAGFVVFAYDNYCTRSPMSRVAPTTTGFSECTRVEPQTGWLRLRPWYEMYLQLQTYDVAL